MSIQEIITNIKRLFEDKEVFLAIVLILVSVASFGLGRASVTGFELKNSLSTEQKATTFVTQDIHQEAAKIKNEADVESEMSVSEESVSTVTQYVASKNGTKYHLPWCAGAKQIKEENKIWFNSKADAEKAGYTPAGNCKGI